MTSRRQFLIGAGTVTTIAIAGCMDILEDGVEAEAQPAIVNDDVATDHNYDFVNVDDYIIDETLEIAGESRDVHVTSWGVVYSKDASDLEFSSDDDMERFEEEAEEFLDQQGAAFAVISTPSESIAGQEVNPVGRMDDEEIIGEFNEEIAEGEVQEIEHTAEHTVTALGEDATTNEFDALLVTDDGDEFDVKLYVTEITNNDDIVLGVGIYPDSVDEQDAVLELTEALEHPADPPETNGD